jgi:branched-chain amino acid transport system ATP-binding protein
VSAPVLELRDVHAGYGRIEVLHGIDLVLARGTVTALLGPNGAGKSTLLRVVSGKTPATSGCVHLEGRHLNGAAPEQLSRAGLCHVPEGRGVFPNLTVLENLRMTTFSSPLGHREVAERAFARFPRLGERRNQLAGRLSGGEQQMLAMARCLVADPGLLLLDEISMGLAPRVVEELYELVAQLAADGITVLLVEQFARTALAVADFAAVMSAGRLTVVGEPGDVAGAVSDAYFGGAA